MPTFTTFSDRLQEVNSYFQNGDLHLGYRRLLDAALETGSNTVYEHTLRFSDRFDEIPEEEKAKKVLPEVSELLGLIEKAYTEPSSLSRVAKLTARQVSKKYSRGAFSLSPVDVTLYPSQIVGLVGENGNGKTTLLRILFGELGHDTGSIDYQLAGTGSNYDPYSIRSQLSFIPQRPAPWYGSLMDNLQFAAAFAGFKGRDNLLWTEMIIARMGLRAFRTYTWGRISSGYKMRFELAKALVARPEVLLLDEPLANLDVLAQQIILEDLRFLARSHTMPLSIILSSQQLYEVEKVSDQVIFLKKGVARYQQIAEDASEGQLPLVVELETTASREALQELFEPMGILRLSFNGGVYIVYLQPGSSMTDLLTVLGQNQIPVKYLRDISVSSRRFFDA